MQWFLPIANANTFTPFAGTVIATQVDQIYAFLLVASLISFIILIGGMTFFVFKYKRKSPTDKTAYITHDHFLEFLWSFVPFVIFIGVFIWGWVVYHDMRTIPADSLEVHVLAKKWDWRFMYKNGKSVVSTIDSANKKVPPTMVVPVHRPVKLIMASEKVNPEGADPLDRPVLHSFFIPAFRIKQDLVPGRYTTLWFKAEHEGLYNVFCAEYCGTGHSAMLGLIKVVSQEEFETWLAAEEGVGLSLADKGKQVYTAKACVGCHSLDGSRLVGPSFKGLWGATREFEDGSKASADENYLRDSVLTPSAHIVKTYPAGVMPTFAGQLTDDDIKAVIEFIKTIK